MTIHHCVVQWSIIKHAYALETYGNTFKKMRLSFEWI